jgi:CBS domain-containing protein
MEQFDSGIVALVDAGKVDAVVTERDVVRAVARGADELVGVVSMRDLFIVETLMPRETAGDHEYAVATTSDRAAYT